MASTSHLFQELFTRMANLERSIEILKAQAPPPPTPAATPSIAELETLKTLMQATSTLVQATSNKLNKHIETYNEVKKITEQTLMMKTEFLVNKKVQDVVTKALQKQDELTIIPESPLVITSSTTIEAPIATAGAQPVQALVPEPTPPIATTGAQSAQAQPATAPQVPLSKKERKKEKAAPITLDLV